MQSGFLHKLAPRSSTINNKVGNNQEIKNSDQKNIGDKNLQLRSYAATGDKFHEFINLLLDPEVDLNAQGATTGKTALHQACGNGRKLQIINLLTAGADFTIRDLNNKLPFEYIQDVSFREDLTRFAEVKNIYHDFKQYLNGLTKKDDMETFRLLHTELSEKVGIVRSAAQKSLDAIRSSELHSDLALRAANYVRVTKNLLTLINNLEHIITTNNIVGSCGHLSYLFCAYLIWNIQYSAIIEAILQLHSTSDTGHELTLFNCNLIKDSLNNVESWGYGVFVIDPLYDRVYFTGADRTLIRKMFGDVPALFLKNLSLNSHFFNKAPSSILMCHEDVNAEKKLKPLVKEFNFDYDHLIEQIIILAKQAFNNNLVYCPKPA